MYSVNIKLCGLPAASACGQMTSRGTSSATPASEPFRAALAEARGRRNIKLFNALMSKSAKFGELARVLEVFEAIKSLVPPLPPNEFSYGILLNAYTRGGVPERCAPVLAEMRQRDLPVTAVVYTTVIKGCVNALDMRGAWAHFDMLLADAQQVPNIRTLNTMLRGCLYVGDLAAVDRLVDLAARCGLQSDQAMRDTVVRAVCQSFSAKQLKRALAAHAPEGLSSLSAAARMDVSLTYALIGKFKRATKALALLESGAADMPSDRYRSGASAARDGSMLTGSMRGVRDFLANPQREVIVRAFSTAAVARFPPITASVSPSPSQRDVANGAAEGGERMGLFARSTPVKLEVGAGTGDWAVANAEADTQGQCAVFKGLNWLPPRLPHARTPTPGAPHEYAAHTHARRAHSQPPCQDPRVQLDDAMRREPLLAGAAIELRWDRACLIHAKAAMRGVHNLAVLAGDAHTVRRDVAAPASLQ